MMMGACVGDRGGDEEEKKIVGMISWEEQLVLGQLHHNCHHHQQFNHHHLASNNNYWDYRHHDDDHHQHRHHHHHPNNIPMNQSSSPPQSCLTSNTGSKTLFGFSSSGRLSQCNNSVNGGMLKKAKVQSSSTQCNLKVRREKLGDRITALHQLVSPFGKTDTSSVLLEAIGYVRFLHSQIEALSLPYLNNSGAGNKRAYPVRGERNCIFPEDPGQDSYHEEPKQDFGSKGYA